MQVEPGSLGNATIWANVDAGDGVAFNQRLDALARTVCEHDPRTHEQRRADAIGPLARLEAQLLCRCGRQDCAAAQNRAAADAAVFHVLANQSTVDGTSNDPGYLPGYGIVPAESVRKVAATAKIKPVPLPVPAEPGEAAESAERAVAEDPAGVGEPRYRPSAA
ncbi:DUF222 domain-containing protein, partial [Mycobacterium syngnathidarum]|uniref:DUF222 domain-containing protein n=1 Tax=Mycobacterium syngnathidarum TaxID=1908205 RepID=UPI001F60DB32